MRSVLGALLLGTAMGLPTLAIAQSDIPAGPVLEIQDDDEAKTVKEIEERLNEILLVDESGQIVMREEFRNSLPFPAERVQQMLGSFVELGEDGKIHLKNIEMVRPYLPMIRGFLGGGGMDRLKELQKLPPDQRRKRMQELFGGGANPFGGQPQPETKPEEPKAKANQDDEPRGRRSLRERLREAARSGTRGGADNNDNDAVNKRLDRLESSVQRMERMMRTLLENQRDSGRRSARREREFFQEEDRRPMRRDRRRSTRERDGRRRGLLGRLFQRRNRDRGARGDRGRRGLFRGFGQRSRVWRQGIQRLLEIMQPEDFDRLRAALRGIAQDFDPQDLQDQGRLMEKLQQSMPPEDVGRFAEIFSEFLATPEGRDMADEVERVVERVEDFVNSQQGERAGDAFKRMQEQFGGGGGSNDGKRGEGFQNRLEELIRGRNRDRRTEEHSDRERRSSRKRHQDERPRAPGSKLY